MNNDTVFVYAISGVFNHSLYVGSTVDVERREAEHRSALRWGHHFNDILQAAYNCFGAENLRMIILETADSEKERLMKEAEWIKQQANDDSVVVCNKRLSGGNTRSGYSLCLETKKRMSQAKSGICRPIEKTRARRYAFIAPDGTTVESFGLKTLCAKYGLNLGHLSRVAQGKLKQHKGWRRG